MLLLGGCTASPIDLALGAGPRQPEFAFPGQPACCRYLSLVNLSSDRDDVIWSIESTDGQSRLPSSTVVGEAPDGYRTTVELAPDALQHLAAIDATLEFKTSAGWTRGFRLSELSATGHVVEFGQSRNVTTFRDMDAFVTYYRADHAKADRGNRRYAFFLIGLALIGIVAIAAFLIRRTRRSAKGVEPSA